MDGLAAEVPLDSEQAYDISELDNIRLGAGAIPMSVDEELDIELEKGERIRMNLHSSCYSPWEQLGSTKLAIDCNSNRKNGNFRSRRHVPQMFRRAVANQSC